MPRSFLGRVTFKSEAGYSEITPTTTVVELRPEGKEQLLPQFSFEANKACPIVVVGRAKNNQLV